MTDSVVRTRVPNAVSGVLGFYKGRPYLDDRAFDDDAPDKLADLLSDFAGKRVKITIVEII